jgi:hypothetical protein
MHDSFLLGFLIALLVSGCCCCNRRVYYRFTPRQPTRQEQEIAFLAVLNPEQQDRIVRQNVEKAQRAIRRKERNNKINRILKYSIYATVAITIFLSLAISAKAQQQTPSDQVLRSTYCAAVINTVLSKLSGPPQELEGRLKTLVQRHTWYAVSSIGDDVLPFVLARTRGQIDGQECDAATLRSPACARVAPCYQPDWLPY